MYKRIVKHFFICTLLVYISVTFSSCLSLKKLVFFQDIPDSTKLSSIKLPTFVPSVIHSGDVLSVEILTVEPAATTPINAGNSFSALSNTAGGGSAGGGGDTGYLVDKDGNIEMPELGKINVNGLTLDQAREVIRKKAEIYLKNPVVLLKSKILKITVLGEVQKPGTLTITNEKLTIMDVLGYTGDVTIYGRRDNILLMRLNDDNTYSTVRINLLNSDIIRSPYYYLKNNDVLYIAPNQGKAATSDVVLSRNISYITISLSILTTLLVLIKK
ncbi:MAG: polysaccharide biosynthesis/export family protein [Mucilaginibacter sp.]|uniref:polysaccharide biosynthesis/export family protein n=1 Tax=Mucilaginibacter sp. TaxID=1882438 RepID=UPI0032642159